MLLTITQAAKELGISAETIRQKIRSGTWPFYKLGPKTTRIDPEEILALGRLATHHTVKKTEEAMEIKNDTKKLKN